MTADLPGLYWSFLAGIASLSIACVIAINARSFSAENKFLLVLVLSHCTLALFPVIYFSCEMPWQSAPPFSCPIISDDHFFRIYALIQLAALIIYCWSLFSFSQPETGKLRLPSRNEMIASAAVLLACSFAPENILVHALIPLAVLAAIGCVIVAIYKATMHTDGTAVLAFNLIHAGLLSSLVFLSLCIISKI